MRLLVSVADAADASVALVGGADIIDAKDPQSGALGAVSLATLRRIGAAVAGARPLTAALGDALDEAELERGAHAFAAAGACLIKVGFAGTANKRHVAALIKSAVEGVENATDGRAGVVAVAYVDAHAGASLAPDALVDVAATAGARGVLFDTADKRGPGLCELMAPDRLRRWVRRAHDRGLFVALAGKLTAADFSRVRDAGADVVGVRGAVCDGERTGEVVADKVRELRSLCVNQLAPSAAPSLPGLRVPTVET